MSPSKNRPLCAESIRWAAGQLAQELLALDLDYASGDPRAELARKANSRMADEWNRIERERRVANLRVFYFGTWKGPGHFFYRPGGDSLPTVDRDKVKSIFGYPDGNYQPDNRGEKEGPAALRHKDGWTILAWWDRTEDKRGGCCSAIMFEGEVGFAEMVELLRLHFPRVHGRRDLTQWPGRTRAEGGVR